MREVLLSHAFFFFKQIFNGNVLYSGHSSKAEDTVTKETEEKILVLMDFMV